VTVEPSVVIDTDVASRIMRTTLPEDLRQSLADASLRLTFVTVGELLRGAVHAGWGERRVSALDDWLGRRDTIAGDATVARAWGEITGRALAAGRPLPANDAWVAACCLAHGLPLATLNVRDYERVEGLRLVSRG